ncbi:aminodeoxychorismate/anthranilate synthase component II [Fibrella sp. HMF5335]|uniref:Aminodeoxychorismate/anthranilate synthase component II n=1 Tax=Fibrella rubiginis TaxID=2817060 RepID=A0A939K1X8_9BACT|nr:aminodeoxychorismate/anthranilate synthase component II [Fibrella rubiginis]MBO0935724.1 aminodeoxychorismate/anthranilate synthase component II [Fibrella rubiginis]
MRVLLLDNLDSFTYTLADYLQQAGAECVVRRSSLPLETIINQPYHAIVLSPGPGVPASAGCLLPVIDYYHNRLPMLGVCLGQQAIGSYFGASLQKSPKPMHGKVSTIRVQTTDPLFRNVPEHIRVTRYHSLTLANLPPLLGTLATTANGEIMAIRHRALPIWGVQFHPEAVLTESGLTILRNFITANQPTL